MSTTSPPSKEIQRVSATSEVRNSPTKGDKGLILFEKYHFSSGEIAHANVCSVGVLQRARQSKKLGFDVGKPGNRFALTRADENMIEQHVTSLLLQNIRVTPDYILTLVCFIIVCVISSNSITGTINCSIIQG